MRCLAFLLSGLFLMFAGNSFAQDSNDSIKIIHGFRMRFAQHDTIRSKVEMKEIMKQNPVAYQCMRTSVITSNIGTTMRFLGGVLIFLPVTKKLEGKTPNWKQAGIGLAIVAASLPFVGIAAANAEKAVSIYNSNLLQVGHYKLQYQFGLTDDGVGFKIRL